MKIINRDSRAYTFKLDEHREIIINGKHNMLRNDPNLIMINGYAITEVSNVIWEEILAKYSHAAPIKSNLIYADKSDKDVLAYAKEHEKEKVQFSPLTEADIMKKTMSNDISISNFRDGMS